ncbi:MAG: intermembrane phospholipid transport protein YdbH family protein [Thermodesulfobacteriota bacterium]
MQYKKFFRFGAFVFFVFSALVLLLYALLPLAAEMILMRQIQKNENLAGLKFNIAGIGLAGIHVTDIHKKGLFKADSLSIGYSLKSLSGKHVESITLSGLRLELDASGQQEGSAGEEGVSLEKIGEPALSFLKRVGVIRVTGSALNMKAMDSSFHIPFDFVIDVDASRQRMFLSGRAFLFSQRVDLHAAADFTGAVATVKAVADDFVLDHLSPAVSRMAPEVSLSGKTDIRIEKKQGEDINVSLSNASVEKPVHVLFREVQAGISLDGDTIGISSTFTAKTDYTSEVGMKVEGTYAPNDGNRLSLSAENTGKHSLAVTGAGQPITIDGPQIGVKIDSVSSKIRAVVNAGCKRVNIPDNDITLHDVKLGLPISIPFDESVKTGTVGVSRCVWADRAAVGLQGTVRQVPEGVDMEGRVTSPDIQGFEASFTGTADVTGRKDDIISIRFSTKQAVFSEKSVKRLIGDRFNGIEFEASLSSNGTFRHTGSGLESDVTVDIRKGRVSFPEKGLDIQNINTLIRFDDILAFESRPGLTFFIEKVSMEKILLEDVRIDYTIESENSFLVEKAGFKWCGGNVSAESFRMVPGKDSYSLVFYCDRLRLTDLLETVADFEATGKGSLSGRIPVVYDQGDFSFKDAFLFTSPGSGGNIRLKNTGMITKGIPKGTPQYTRMDLAKEALKNYEYKWAELVFDTEGEKLNVNLRFDGKPANVLPFEYNRETGRFSRVDASSPGSRFQGIKIDVNLTLPFNKVLGYGRRFN